MSNSATPSVVRLYESNIPSGNAYKVSLLLSNLTITGVETISLDILAKPSETRSADFLSQNPNGRIPVVELADGRYLAESNAILLYLAEGSALLPEDPVLRAEVHQWLFFEQYSHERFIAVLKFYTYWGGLSNLSAEHHQHCKVQGQAALDVMERVLRAQPFFVGAAYSVADIALYAYSQSASAIGYRVGPAVQAWLARVQQQPGYVPIKPDPLGKAPSAQ